MSVYYCLQCGHGNSYELTKPKFCGSCGKSASAITSTRQVNRPAPVEEEDYVPNMAELHATIEIDNDGVTKIGDVWKSRKMGGQRDKKIVKNPLKIIANEMKRRGDED